MDGPFGWSKWSGEDETLFFHILNLDGVASEPCRMLTLSFASSAQLRRGAVVAAESSFARDRRLALARIVECAQVSAGAAELHVLRAELHGLQSQAVLGGVQVASMLTFAQQLLSGKYTIQRVVESRHSHGILEDSR
eukprot:3686323-Pleurochrysis_carterae.AAC.3